MARADGGGGGAGLGPGAEFDLIRRLLASPAGVEEGAVRVGPGDDAAVLEGGWVVTCDLSVEDVHFRRDWLDPTEIGGRAVRAAVSDMAAMAAEPVAVLMSLAGPPEDHASGVLLEMGRGARAAVEDLGAALAGGDVTRTPGPLVIDVVALGRSEAPILRRGARPGDHVWVTGRLGAAAAAVRLLSEGHVPPPALRRALSHPPDRIVAARLLADTGLVRALMDLSDGLEGDAGHIAVASEVALIIEETDVPVDPAAVQALGRATALEAALSGGEDYELLLAADPELDDRVDEMADRVGIPLTRVGRVEAGRGVRVRTANGELREGRGGWDHFAPGTGR